MSKLLVEYNSYDSANILLEKQDDPNNIGQKSLFMKGIFLQAELKNHNGRIYPKNEIENAVNSLNRKIKQFGPVMGELTHPEGLEIDPRNVSHSIVDMWMEGNDGMGKLKILKTETGNIVRALLEEGIKLGVSSRGSGETVTTSNGILVKGFEIVTIDIVSTPSAPNAYPTTIYEQLVRSKNSKELLKLSEAINHDYKAQKFFKQSLTDWIKEIDLKK